MLRGLMANGTGRHENQLARACLNLGDLYVEMNETEHAAASFEEALEHYSNLLKRGVNCQMENTLCHVRLGEWYFQKGEFRTAGKHYEQAYALVERLNRKEKGEYDDTLEEIRIRLQMIGNII